MSAKAPSNSAISHPSQDEETAVEGHDPTRGSLGADIAEHPAFSVDTEVSRLQAKPLGPDAAVSLALIVMMNDPAYRYLFVADLEWALIPPIMAKQYKLYLNGSRPVAFAAWARVSESVAERLLKGGNRLAPADWTSGDRVWLRHLVAPFGGGEQVLEDLKRTALVGREFRIYQTRLKSKKAEVGTPEGNTI